MPVPAILLAAGASRRLGRPKQLVEYRGETLLARATRIALEAGASPLIVVLGAHANEILAAVPLNRDSVVVNQAWGQGMASSIRAGLLALDGTVSGALILACDQPRLTASHLRTLLSEFEARNETAIVASRYAGVRGTPAVFPRSAFARLKALMGDHGARPVLNDPRTEVIEVEFEGGAIDVDSPADLAQLD